MRKRIRRRERGERQSRGDRLLQVAEVSKSTNEAVMGFYIVLVGSNGGAEGEGGLVR